MTEPRRAQTALQAALRLSREAMGLIKAYLTSLAIYEVVFYVLSASVSAPLVAWATSLLIRSSGRTAVSNFEIVSFLTSPSGLTAGTLAVTVLLTLRYLQQAVILRRVTLPATGAKHDWLQALLDTRHLLGRLLRLGLLQVALFAVVALPFVLAALAIKQSLLTEHDLNYYLVIQPPEFRRAKVLIVLVAIVAGSIGCLLWTLLIYAVPLMVFTGARATAALRRSISIAREHFGVSLLTVLSFGAAIMIVTALSWIVTQALEQFVLRLCTDSLFQVVAGVALVMTIELVLAVVLAFFAVAFWCGSVAALSRHAGLIDRLERPSTAAPAADTTTQAQAAAPSTRRWVGALLVLLSVGTAGGSWLIVSQLEPGQRVQVAAHRGASMRAPENTLSAIEAAIEDGADLIEIDVQETRDGVIIVLHDSDLMRVASDSRRIWDLDAETLRTIDVGAWFGSEFEGQHVPTLAEVIQRVRGRARLLIELKYNGHDDELAGRVVDIVEGERFEEDCLIMSLDYDGLCVVRSRRPDIPIGLTVGASLGDVSKLDVDFLALRGSLLTPTVYERIRASGKQLHVWTVNQSAEMYRYLSLGVDHIITDDVARAVSLRDEYESMSLPEQILLGFRYHLSR